METGLLLIRNVIVNLANVACYERVAGTSGAVTRIRFAAGHDLDVDGLDGERVWELAVDAASKLSGPMATRK